MLGRFHEISVETGDIAESVAFYERLGFSQCGTTDTWQHPYGVMTDGKLFLGLHQFKFPSPAISYVHDAHLGASRRGRARARRGETRHRTGLEARR